MKSSTNPRLIRSPRVAPWQYIAQTNERMASNKIGIQRKIINSWGSAKKGNRKKQAPINTPNNVSARINQKYFFAVSLP